MVVPCLRAPICPFVSWVCLGEWSFADVSPLAADFRLVSSVRSVGDSGFEKAAGGSYSAPFASWSPPTSNSSGSMAQSSLLVPGQTLVPLRPPHFPTSALTRLCTRPGLPALVVMPSAELVTVSWFQRNHFFFLKNTSAFIPSASEIFKRNSLH